MIDVKAMFYQVFVADQHRNMLNFLLWENGDINKQPQHYHMNIHVFWGTWLPNCSNYALRRTARGHERKYGKEVADILRGDFYVDDLLKSVQDEQTAIKLMKDVTARCAEGELWFAKLVSNSKGVLVSISEGERTKGLQDQ